MRKVEILCPRCGKLITKVSEDSKVLIFGHCRRCRAEYEIPYNYRAAEPNDPR